MSEELDKEINHILDDNEGLVCELHDYELFYGIGSPKLEAEGMVCKKCKHFTEVVIPPTKL